MQLPRFLWFSKKFEFSFRVFSLVSSKYIRIFFENHGNPLPATVRTPIGIGKSKTCRKLEE